MFNLEALNDNPVGDFNLEPMTPLCESSGGSLAIKLQSK